MSHVKAQPTRNTFAPDEPIAERLLHMLVATSAELAVTRGRLDTLERYLTEVGTLPEGGLDAGEVNAVLPPGSAAESAWREQFLDKLFESLQNEIHAAQLDAPEDSP